jgi:hypothetical protein
LNNLHASGIFRGLGRFAGLTFLPALADSIDPIADLKRLFQQFILTLANRDGWRQVAHSI